MGLTLKMHSTMHYNFCHLDKDLLKNQENKCTNKIYRSILPDSDFTTLELIIRIISKLPSIMA